MANSGVVDYIGGSQYTYWYEDFYWGVGYGSIVAQPTYASTTSGSYDRVFHDQANETAVSEWYVTAYQMIVITSYSIHYTKLYEC